MIVSLDPSEVSSFHITVCDTRSAEGVPLDGPRVALRDATSTHFSCCASIERHPCADRGDAPDTPRGTYNTSDLVGLVETEDEVGDEDSELTGVDREDRRWTS